MKEKRPTMTEVYTGVKLKEKENERKNKKIERNDNNIEVLTKWLTRCQTGSKCNKCRIQRDCSFLKIELGIKGTA